MQIKSLLMAAIMLLAFSGAAFAADTKLPAPMKDGGPNVLKAIDERASTPQTGFPAAKLSPAELGTVLWAATGLNRDGENKWTVPMAIGLPPYCKLYVLDETGAYLYDWENHALQMVTDKDIRTDIIMQDFAKKAPQSILMVLDDNGPAAKIKDAEGRKEMELTALGAMSQNMYLSVQALNAGTRMVFSIERAKAKELLQLPEGLQPVCVMLLGKY